MTMNISVLSSVKYRRLARYLCYLVICVTVLLLSSCTQPNGSSKNRQIGYIGSDISVYVPEKVLLDETFTVYITTYSGGWGSSCTESGGVEQTRRGNKITLVPYLIKVVPSSGICTTDFASIEHSHEFSLDTTGEYIIRVPSLSYGVKEYLEYTVVVE